MAEKVGDLDQEMERNIDDGLSNTHEEGRIVEAPPPPPGSLRMVLKHSDGLDMLLMALGTIGCVVDGLSMSAVMLVLSKMMNGYAITSLTPQDINQYALALFYVAAGVGLGAFLEGFCWARTAERKTSRLRTKYLQAVLRQEVGFFDRTQGASMTSQVVSSISIDTLVIQGVLSEKLPNFIMNIAMSITALMAAVYLCWRLAIVTIPAVLLLIVTVLASGKLLSDVGKKIQEAYKVAGGIVEQALSSVRTVYSYVREEQTVQGYSTALRPALNLGVKQGLLKGITIGTIGITYAVWALQGWYGSILVTEKGVKGGNVLTSGVCIVYGGLALGGSLINVKHFMEANAAAALIFEMIDRVPSIDYADQQGKIGSNVRGELEFKDINFAYPSRPDNQVLKMFNLRVMAGQTVGLVGGSGSGKSTVINLLERFYDPLAGEILLDGINIKTLHLKWLRSQMGLVSQEPILFATSVKENILFGKEEASQEEIVLAAKAANAHNFITQLPNGYDTQVGQLGIQMSGGQKQRISIARALLRDPKILLLDEATSSLDSRSEKAVQDALNQASIGRTTIIIAHRLSTLRNADSIAVIQSGQVVESGSHDQLIRKNDSPYSAMVQQQQAFMSDKITPTSEASETNDFYPNRDAHEEETKNELTPPLSDRGAGTDQKAEEYSISPPFWHLVQMIASQWKSTLFGCAGGLCTGLIPPLHYFCMGALLSVYFFDDHDTIKSQTRIYCFAFLAFAVSVFIANVIQHYYFAVMGENLTKRVREATFAKILTFETEWFDQENNSSGALYSRLATDAAMVKNLVADSLAMVTQTISGATLAIILGLVLAWKLALVAIALQPLIIIAFYLKAIMMRSMSKKILEAQNKSSELASEAVGNHRIISAFYSQEKVMALFEVTQIGPKNESHKQSWYAGLGLFIAQFLTSANAALLFWYGGNRLRRGEINYKHLFQTFFILVSTGRIIAETASTNMDLVKGMNALRSICTILKRRSKMNPDMQDGIKPAKMNGDIEFKEVDFFYPTRPKQMILIGLSLKIDGGRIAALVGQSGSGKSTVIRMIQRFYDPSKGSVEIDGLDIKSYNLRALRSHIAWVGQEPSIFAGTIHDNVAYGKENATEAEIIEAANLANAHGFISSMKDGYATYCGERGVQLSGGQKQRLALARAILKNPSVLLLDEATSALDIKSENMVREALEKIMVGRTCLVVAHRLSTVQKSDKISVIDKGRIVEEGSHGELLGKGEKGAYYSLVRLQQFSTFRSAKEACLPMAGAISMGIKGNEGS